MTRHRLHHAVHHTVDFLLLILLVGLGFGGLVYFQHQVITQVVISLVLVCLYALWGIIHHYHDGNLTRDVVMEYVSVAALTGFILISFLLRA